MLVDEELEQQWDVVASGNQTWFAGKSLWL